MEPLKLFPDLDNGNLVDEEQASLEVARNLPTDRSHMNQEPKIVVDEPYNDNDDFVKVERPEDEEMKEAPDNRIGLDLAKSEVKIVGAYEVISHEELDSESV